MTHDDKIEESIKKGEHDEDVYEKEGREDLTEDAEISPTEEGFMQGYEEGGKQAKCPKCGKAIVEKEGVVEREFEDHMYFFCSEKCAENYHFKK